MAKFISPHEFASSDEPIRRANKCPLCPRSAVRLTLFLKHLETEHRDYLPERRDLLWAEAERLEDARESGGQCMELLMYARPLTSFQRHPRIESAKMEPPSSRIGTQLTPSSLRPR